MKKARLQSTCVVGLILLAGASLSACNRKADGDAAGNRMVGSSSARPEDKFGKKFGEAYRASPNAEPARVADGDLVPVSLTAEPVAVN